VIGVLSLCLVFVTTAPYEFEVTSRGFVESKLGSGLLDRRDDISLATGARGGFSVFADRDTMITLEGDYSFHWFRSSDARAASNKFYQKHYLTGSVGFYEFFNPYAFRLALGSGMERRLDRSSALIEYRGGLGYFLNSRLGFFGDITGRYVFRKRDHSSQMEGSLSVRLQW